MKSFTSQPFSEHPTESDHIHDWTPPMESAGDHSNKKQNAITEWTEHMTANPPADDAGMMGSHTTDRTILGNAHPHAQHSVGYHVESPRHEHGHNHGFESMHIVHHKRDKNSEHHPPKGLYNPGIVDHEKFTQSVF